MRCRPATWPMPKADQTDGRRAKVCAIIDCNGGGVVSQFESGIIGRLELERLGKRIAV